jgi:hypothetical protein
MRHRPEQDLAAEASVEGIEVEVGDRFFRDVRGLWVRPRRADQLRQKQLVEVRIALSIDLAKRLLEDGNCVPASVREPERAAELERNRAAPRWLGELFEPGAKVVGGGGAVRSSLGKTELYEDFCPRGRVHLLLERASEIFDRGVGCPLDERPLRRLAERRDHERVGPRS